MLSRSTILQGILLAAGALTGMLLAYVDSLPRWDDAGIIAAGLFLASGLLTLLGFQRPWLMALAVGLWIPLREFVLSGRLDLFLLMVFPLLGAYAGFLVRSAFSKGNRPA